MYKLLLNSAAAFAFALPLVFGFAGSSYAEDSRTNRQIEREIKNKNSRVDVQEELLKDRRRKLRHQNQHDRHANVRDIRETLLEVAREKGKVLADEVELQDRAENNGE